MTIETLETSTPLRKEMEFVLLSFAETQENLDPCDTYNKLTLKKDIISGDVCRSIQDKFNRILNIGNV